MQKILQSFQSFLEGDTTSLTIARPPKKEHGDVMLNTFLLAKSRQVSPNIVSQEIATCLLSHPYVAATHAIGGYVNITLSLEGIAFACGLISFSPSQDLSGTVTIVDYIGVNVGKPAHIGHLCTPSHGQSYIEMTRFLGGSIISDSHFGDWGGIFGKLIVAFQKWGVRSELEVSPIDYLLSLYIRITAEAKAFPEIDQECRDAFICLSRGEASYVALWNEFTGYTTQEVEKILSLINVDCDYHIGESFYQGIPEVTTTFLDIPPLRYTMQMVIDELITKGIAIKNEDGSVGVTFDDESKLPSTVLQKNDGGMLYITSDLAAIKYRLTNGWNPSKICYFTDLRQALHFRQVFEIARQAWPELVSQVELIHAGNGAIRLKEGAMSTRSGNIIRLETLISDAFDRVSTLLREKGRELSPENLQSIAVGAIKYAYLAQDREKDVIFDADKAIALEGNSGPYVQYAAVRASEIVRQSNDTIAFSPETLISEHIAPIDRELLATLLQTDQVIRDAQSRIRPHMLAQHAYTLAAVFNSFYVQSDKISTLTDKDKQAWKLFLVSSTYAHLKGLFGLLAISLPDAM